VQPPQPVEKKKKQSKSSAALQRERPPQLEEKRKEAKRGKDKKRASHQQFPPERVTTSARRENDQKQNVKRKENKGPICVCVFALRDVGLRSSFSHLIRSRKEKKEPPSEYATITTTEDSPLAPRFEERHVC
jgi:hypothetical protein